MLKKEIKEKADIYNKVHSVIYEVAKEKVKQSPQKKSKSSFFILACLTIILSIIAMINLFITKDIRTNCIICGLLAILYFMLFLVQDKSKTGLSSKLTIFVLSITWLFNFIVWMF